MKNSNLFILLALAAIVLTTLACASGNPYASVESPAGFWKGLWDGMTVLFSGLISIFNHSYGLYEVNNNGGMYNLGFWLGISLLAGASRASAGK
ncbi:TPA: hypothetical protein DIU27_01490 [Candidatus Collierbacteria bacterium]|uniref:Lipoprotein n=1 Tax=Candidatus Collierbacteria bacterium GW2011_GWB2_44_22 TaxID=1618387 RepID=A0A0G1K5S3_9BACT|nr:MAG: hypothetical protein UW31_C0005G0143 [Candidatus Collierbacteria bacterium GW2011_GWA2_44_13]KKT51632.1 MAG: hypothetical protein UW44_C0010G0070 [Candidatus Collierbacteria bacterium GW2011_GWB2_44_22]KKT63083.1 MAG: hypothetical protein UW56_C0002G0068 [Candidatus Collierbacteria bacterium GW2011_GWD1_44_27]KKT64005.1 MAG: hypothetical protein UW58_C0051G0007 [Candidatus Collierbacteria bacterium GW2011_GWC2_44_30]KKT68971.1 MAG: hypothetical protein UW64_C0006G0027 [Microgenomates gr